MKKSGNSGKDGSVKTASAAPSPATGSEGIASTLQPGGTRPGGGPGTGMGSIGSGGGSTRRKATGNAERWERDGET